MHNKSNGRRKGSSLAASFLLCTTVIAWQLCKLLKTTDMAGLVGFASTKRVSKSTLYKPYQPSVLEEYFLNHVDELGLNETQDPRALCPIWTNITGSEIYFDLQAYTSELEEYQRLVSAFTPVSDVRRSFARETPEQVCKQLELHPDGLKGIFRGGHLSDTPLAGLVEPLLPPLRHPKFCFDGGRQHLMSLGYLVHDFAQLCRTLKPTSRSILIDMGASLSFRSNKTQEAPIYLMKTYRKFGMPFDHIYAFEAKKTDSADVYSRLPSEFFSSYHWINLPVSPEPDSALNPLKMLLENFDSDDLIVVKLDIDTPRVEMPLVHQLLEDRRFSSLVDHFYFEHHVVLKDLLPWWGQGVAGSVSSSLNLFQDLRKKGIAAHYWP
jgi:hypothetical protein